MIKNCEDCGIQIEGYANKKRCKKCKYKKIIERTLKSNETKKRKCVMCGDVCYGRTCKKCFSKKGSPLTQRDCVRRLKQQTR